MREGDLGVAERQLDVGVHGGNRVSVGTVNGVSLPERELVSSLSWVGTTSDSLCRKRESNTGRHSVVEIKEEIVMTVTYLVFLTRSPSQGGGEGEAVLLSRSHLELCDLLRPDTKGASTNINAQAIILTKSSSTY